jgi:crotonobetainyl-CoA:carnitine CoA-transferase CaiB-like acyl-CoA transferase
LSSSAYGPDGPNALLPGVDAVAQAAGGIASLYGEKGSRMMTGQHAVADETGAMVASFALMVALYHKKMTGEGTKIETSLLGSIMRLMGHSMTRVLFIMRNYLAAGLVYREVLIRGWRVLSMIGTANRLLFRWSVKKTGKKE